MHEKRFIPIVILLVLGLSGVFYILRSSTADNKLVASGTIEATESRVGSTVGGRVDAVLVREGDTVRAGQVLVEVHPAGSGRAAGRELVHAPFNGVVLYRAIEPGEVASPATPLITVADLEELTLTVYIAEDRYGLLKLGQEYPVTVDSYPSQVFTGAISYIADQAEFTPRNVQTTDNRKTTVFGVKLDLLPSDGKLKPGMPADVHFDEALP